MKRFLRRAGRVVREVLLFPFRLIWWLLRGLRRSAQFVGDAIGDVIEGIFDGIGR